MNRRLFLAACLLCCLISCTRKKDDSNQIVRSPLSPEAVGKLHGYLHKLMCGDLQDDRSCKLSSDQEQSFLNVIVLGNPTVTYDVKLRIRGLLEPRRYTGGALHDPANKWFYAGGVPDTLRANNGQAYNIYKISVSDPEQDYYLNCDTDNHLGSGYMPSHSIYKVDYTVTIPAKGGSFISVITDDEAGSGMINNADNQIVEGIPSGLIEQPWDGQFFYIEVESIVPANR